MGRTPVAAPILITAWIPIRQVIPAAIIRPSPSGDLLAVLKPRYIKVANNPNTAMVPIRPNSSPIMEKMKSKF